MFDSLRRKFAPVILVLLIGAISMVMVITDFSPSLKGSLVSAKAGAAATVNGKSISARDFRRAVDQRLSLFQSLGQNLTEVQIQQFRIREAALEGLIQQELLIQLAHEIGVKVSQEELKSKISEIFSQQASFKDKTEIDPDTYKEILRMNGFATPQVFEDLVLREILVKKMRETLSLSVAVTNEELKREYLEKNDTVKLEFVSIETELFKKAIKVTSQEIASFIAGGEKNTNRLKNWFETHKHEYNQKETVKARHILVRGKDAEKKIKEIATKVTSSNFISLANRYSEDPTGKGKGGLLGWFGRGEMVPEFEKVAFSLKPGVMSKPVKTNFGYHLILVEEKRGAVEKTWEDVKNQVALEVIRLDRSSEAREMANQAAEEIRSALSRKGGAGSLLKKYGLKLLTPDKLTRLSTLPGSLQDPRVLQDAFKEETTLAKEAKVYDTGGGFIVARLVDRSTPSPEKLASLGSKDSKEWGELRQSYTQEKEARIFNSLMSELTQKGEIQRNLTLFPSSS